jgi:hypothetical protein
MVVPLTSKPTRKTEDLTKAPLTIASRREEDAALKEVVFPRYRSANDILETKVKDGNTVVKAPVPRINPKANETPTAPKPHTHPIPPAKPPTINPVFMIRFYILFHFAVHMTLVPLSQKFVYYESMKRKII